MSEDGKRIVLGVDSGRAFVYDGPGASYFSGLGWRRVELIPSGARSASYGVSVAVSGDKVMAGDPEAMAIAPAKGVAHYFQASDKGWFPALRLASPSAAGHRFGSSVAVAAHRIAATGNPDSPHVSGAHLFELLRTGDADMTAEFNAGDLITVGYQILGLINSAPGSPMFVNSDVTGDTIVDMRDLNYIVDCLLGRAVPVLPTGFCTTSPTPHPGKPELPPPVVANQLVTQTGLTTQSAPLPGGRFLYSITASFRRGSSGGFLYTPKFRIAELQGPGCPCVVRGAPSALPGELIDIGATMLAPNEAFTHTFAIELARPQMFTFRVDVVGVY